MRGPRAGAGQALRVSLAGDALMLVGSGLALALASALALAQHQPPLPPRLLRSVALTGLEGVFFVARSVANAAPCGGSSTEDESVLSSGSIDSRAIGTASVPSSRPHSSSGAPALAPRRPGLPHAG